MSRSNTQSPLPDGQKIGFVQAGWHSEIVDQSRLSFIDHLNSHGNISSGNIDIINVPGSLEIPLQCQRLALAGDHALIVAAGLIVDGGIYRHEFVAATVLDGMMKVQLQTNVPILSVVLTPQQFDESEKRIHYFADHFKIKGEEAARACLQTLQNQY